MDILKYIIKKCERSDGYTNWMALYIDGIKELESYSFDIDLILNNYGTELNYIIDLIIEDDEYFMYDIMDELFPDIEDFSYMLDNNDINIGSYIFLEQGMFEVISLEEDYRPEGSYKMKHWELIDGKYICSEYNIDWIGHSIIKVKVKGLDGEIIWEDYNYQQSFLYLYLKENGKLV